MTLQTEILKELHVGHVGMTKMKAIARSYVYWRNMDIDIENMVRDCKKCNQKRCNPPRLDPHPWEEPAAPWHRIHIDFFGPMNGNYFLIVVDAFSKWLEVFQTKNTTSDWCIKKLSHLFTTFGLPLVIVSDNGSQFTSSTFKRYLDNNGICHRTCAPFHPSSNGQAERFVQTVKTGLLSMTEEQGEIQDKIDRLVTQLRKVPSSTTGLSAYKLMFGRDIRTKLNILADMNGIKRNTVRIVPKRRFEVGQRVKARDYYGKDKWKTGIVVSRKGDVMYVVNMEHGPTWTRHTDQLLPIN